jgi:cell division protein FtsB
LNVSDDDTYESNTKEQSSTAGRVDALNYVSADHPLLPSRRARSANNMIEMRSRVRHHTAFWWDVFLAMQEDKNPHRYRALRAELTEIQRENERLKQGISKIRQQSAIDRATIDYLSRATPSTRQIQKGSLETELELPQNPPTGSCPPRTPHDAIEKSYIQTCSERKRKRITIDSSERSDESETDISLTKKIKWL